MSITKDDLVKSVNADYDRRRDNVDNIHRYFDSIIVPLAQQLNCCRVWADCREINFSVAGTANDLVTIFKAMRLSGFVPDNRPKAGEPSFSARFKRPNEDVSVFYLAFSSTVCRRVLVRKEMVETPIYETVCGEVEAAPADVFVESAPVADEVPF